VEIGLTRRSTRKSVSTTIVTDRGADRSFSATTELVRERSITMTHSEPPPSTSAQLLKSDGSFAGLAGLAPYSEVNDFLAADLLARQMGEF
jgi:hypothetical protein